MNQPRSTRKTITQDDINREIEALKALQCFVKDAGLDAQIDTLEHRLTVQNVRYRYGKDMQACDAAMSALGWRNGWRVAPPSKGWGAP